MRLEGRTAIVTGASSGIGFATAARLVREGARVLMVARSAAPLAAAAERIGERAMPVVADVGNAEGMRTVVDRSTALIGTPDIVVASAGRFAIGPIGELSLSEVEAIISANLLGSYLVAHAFVPPMRQRGSGHVVHIGSVADRSIFPENGAYSASKFGVRAVHEVLREELRGSGVRCSLVSPAAVDTPAWDAIQPETRPGFPSRAQMLRPDDVADTVLYVLTQPPHVCIDELRVGSA